MEISDISDKNGTSQSNKMAIFDKKWNFWNLMASFNKLPSILDPPAGSGVDATRVEEEAPKTGLIGETSTGWQYPLG